MKINSIFIEPGDSDGPRKFCEICKRYYEWIGGVYRCPACGGKGDPIASTRKVLKADNHEPMIASKQDPKKQRSPDFPPGAQIISDEEIV